MFLEISIEVLVDVVEEDEDILHLEIMVETEEVVEVETCIDQNR